VNPIFSVTCQWATLPPSIWPRVSTTSNQRMLRTVFAARARAFSTASSMPLADDPVSSIFL
jgi:hypothetical protein